LMHYQPVSTKQKVKGVLLREALCLDKYISAVLQCRRAGSTFYPYVGHMGHREREVPREGMYIETPRLLCPLRPK